MLAMGRALMGKPKLLMLDEPSLGLAPLMVREIFNIVADLRAAGVAILLVEQNARAALQISDYGYVLETGELALEGPSAELAANPRVAATYLGKRVAAANGRRRTFQARQYSGCRDAARPSCRIAHWKESLDRSLRSPRQQRTARRGAAPAARARGPRRRRAFERARVDPLARRRFRRPLFPVFADGELEPRGGHRQGGLVFDRPRRRHSRRPRRKAGVRVLGRHLARRAERGGGGRARHRPPGTVRRRRARTGSALAHSLYAPADPVASLPEEAKVALLERLEQMARKRDPRVAQVMASIAGEYEAVLIARSDGIVAADVRPLVRVSLTVIVEEGGRREQGHSGGGGRFDYGYFTDAMLGRTSTQAVSQALLNLGARAAPAGTMTVVLGHGWPGILLHEAIGHGLEGDFNRKGTSAFSGRIGQRVAAPGYHGDRRRDHRPPARLAQRRRRRQSDAAHGADRGRHPARATCRIG